MICDDSNCHLFFSDDNGHFYRAQTTIADFPNGFGEPVVVIREDANPTRLFEACNVYKMKGTNKYLALIEAFDADSAYRRYFRSWTADALDGAWTPLADTFAAPFARPPTSPSTAAAWTARHQPRRDDPRRPRRDPDHRRLHLQYLYQGLDPASTALPYNSLPWRLGLITPPGKVPGSAA